MDENATYAATTYDGNGATPGAMRDGQVALENAPAAAGQQMQATAEMAHTMSSDMLRFTGERLQAYATHLQSLAGCHTMQSVVEQQMAFMRSSMQEFGQAASSMFSAAQRQQRQQLGSALQRR